MKAKVILFWSLLFVLTASLFAIVFIPNECEKPYDIVVNIFGGAILALLICTIEYNREKQIMMEDFGRAAKRILSEINKFPFFELENAIGYVSNNDELAKNCLRRKWQIGCSKLIPSEIINNRDLEVNPFSSVDGLNIEEQERLFFENVNTNVALIEDCMRIYIDFVEKDFTEFWNFETRSAFLLPSRKRNELLKKIYDDFDNMRNKIIERVYHFREYLKTSNGNSLVMTHFLEELNGMFFVSEVVEGKNGTVGTRWLVTKRLYYKSFSNDLQKFSCLVYGKEKKYKEVEDGWGQSRLLAKEVDNGKVIT